MLGIALFCHFAVFGALKSLKNDKKIEKISKGLASITDEKIVPKIA